VIPSRGRRIDGLSCGFFRSGRTTESAEDKTLRAQPGGIAGSEVLSAMVTVWHWDKVILNFRSGPVTIPSDFPYSC
jgi:hypothetical protein